MPELPEISHFKEYVDSTSLHQKITAVDFPETSLLQASKSDFTNALHSKEFPETHRLGKYLFLKINNANWLVFHFGMTGKLDYYQTQDPPKYAQLIISFDQGGHLAFSCKRKLGKIYLTSGVADFQKAHNLGKDALDFSWKDFNCFLKQKKGMIKSALMDQHSIAGIGNLYSDEMLFQSKIHPKTKVENLGEKERKTLFKQMQRVLEAGVEYKKGQKDLPSGFLLNNRKEGETCPDNSGKVEKIKVSGRSTFFIPHVKN